MFYAISGNCACYDNGKHSSLLYRQLLPTVSEELEKGESFLIMNGAISFIKTAQHCLFKDAAFSCSWLFWLAIINLQKHLPPIFGLIFIST